MLSHFNHNPTILNYMGINAYRSLERKDTLSSSSDEWFLRIANNIKKEIRFRTWSPERFINAVNKHFDRLKQLSGQEIEIELDKVKKALQSTELNLEQTVLIFAIIKNYAAQELGTPHYDSQLFGGWVMLNGCIAEMQTGEGKTLTATLPAATVALAGLPVHIVTTNDYLAQRDAAELKPLYEKMGLTVAHVIAGMSDEERRAAYACNVTYCSNKELVFDYLKDKLAHNGNQSMVRDILEKVWRTSPTPTLMRGLHFAIVDEADSILIDDARTPLILAKPTENTKEEVSYQRALAQALLLIKSKHFQARNQGKSIEFTKAGQDYLTQLVEDDTGLWKNQRYRETLIAQALRALHCLHKDKHYVIKDDKVAIIDENTGRLMQDRSWEQGLHQMIELKENVSLTKPRETMISLSFQRFFRRYINLSGMTGTASEASSELRKIYNLPIKTVPTNKPVLRKVGSRQFVSDEATKHEVISILVKQTVKEGRPVLIGTYSVKSSESLSVAFTKSGIEHCLLSAKQNSEEADIISKAGSHGQVTIATNMAGRGTDIKLEAGVAKRGGLHVIMTEMHESRRIDRQLFGRCGRQGEPGSYSSVISLDDEVLINTTPTLWLTWYKKINTERLNWLPHLMMWYGQNKMEKKNRRERYAMYKEDKNLQASLAFSKNRV